MLLDRRVTVGREGKLQTTGPISAQRLKGG